MAKINVLIVDDHGVVREGLRTYLELMDDIEVVGEAENGVEAVTQVRLHQPDVVLMDLVMPEMDGVEATRQVIAISPTTKVLVLSSFADDEKVFPAIKAGAACVWRFATTCRPSSRRIRPNSSCSSSRAVARRSITTSTPRAAAPFCSRGSTSALAGRIAATPVPLSDGYGPRATVKARHLHNP